MKKIIGLVVGVLLLATMVTAITLDRSVRHLTTYERSGRLTVTGEYFDNRDYPTNTGVIQAFCKHDGNDVLIGDETYHLSNSADGKTYHFLIQADTTDTLCTVGDLAWVAVDDFSSKQNVIFHKGKHKVKIVEPVLTPEETALNECNAKALDKYNVNIMMIWLKENGMQKKIIIRH